MKLVHSMLGTFIYLHLGGAGQLFYEKEIQPGGLTLNKHYISAGGRTIGMYVSRSDSVTYYRYFHGDQLSSVTSISNPSGVKIETLAYEAFGKRRNPNGSDDTANTLSGVETKRGFTSHEELDEIGLVHMNGRIYDPVIAKFTTPDPFIQNPNDVASYNRYAYVNNNPLAYTDPSGYISWGGVKLSGQNIQLIAAIVIAYFTGYYDWGAGAGIFGSEFGMANAMAGGFAGGVVGSGTLSGGVHGAFSATLFYEAGQFSTDMAGGAEAAEKGSGPWSQVGVGRAGAHAVAGCVSAAADGGNCGRGALSAGATKFIGARTPMNDGVGGAVKWAVLGGTASSVMGGKFSNGAMTATFQYLFNQLARSRQGPGWGIQCFTCSASSSSVEDPFDDRRQTRYWGQIDRLTDATDPGGQNEYQYALTARSDGVYPDVRNGTVYLKAGDVWKYGTTVDPAGRYSPNELSTLNVDMVVQTQGSPLQVRVMEKVQLFNYFVGNGSLPPGNKIFR